MGFDYDRHELKKQRLRIFWNFRLRWLELKENDSQETAGIKQKRGGINSYRKVTLLTPNDDYSGRTAPLTSKRFILYIYSTNIGTQYFKHVIYSPFFPLQNAVCFIILPYLVPVLFTFYIQSVQKSKI